MKSKVNYAFALLLFLSAGLTSCSDKGYGCDYFSSVDKPERIELSIETTQVVLKDESLNCE